MCATLPHLRQALLQSTKHYCWNSKLDDYFPSRVIMLYTPVLLECELRVFLFLLMKVYSRPAQPPAGGPDSAREAFKIRLATAFENSSVTDPSISDIQWMKLTTEFHFKIPDIFPIFPKIGIPYGIPKWSNWPKLHKFNKYFCWWKCTAYYKS